MFQIPKETVEVIESTRMAAWKRIIATKYLKYTKDWQYIEL